MNSDGKLPILRPRELAKALERMGFVHTRKSRGSHFRYVHPDGVGLLFRCTKGRRLAAVYYGKFCETSASV